MHAGVFEEYGKRHSRPDAATRKSVCVLSRGIGRNSECSGRTSWSAVGIALQKMNSRYGREALQFFHGENRGMVDHAVNQEAMFNWIDVGRLVTVRDHEMQGSGSDDSD